MSMFTSFPTSFEFVFWVFSVGIVLRLGSRLCDFFLEQLVKFVSGMFRKR